MRNGLSVGRKSLAHTGSLAVATLVWCADAAAQGSAADKDFADCLSRYNAANMTREQLMSTCAGAGSARRAREEEAAARRAEEERFRAERERRGTSTEPQSR